MGAGTVQAQVSKRNRRTKRARPMSEINVTPFVDVMLVLLIIFMVTAPMLTVGIPIERESDLIYLRADGSVPYEFVAKIMGAINGAGYSNVGLVTDVGSPDIMNVEN